MIQSTLCSKCKGENDRMPQAYCSTCRRAYNARRPGRKPAPTRPQPAAPETLHALLVAKGPRWPAAYPPRLGKCST